MLKEHCRNFRAAYHAGREIDHLEHCAECREWADATPRLCGFGADLPLPAALRNHLQDLHIPRCTLEQLPQLAMPPGLRRRLVAIPVRYRTPPVWITRARYGIAASLLLAFLSVSALGDTVSRGHQAVATINRQVEESQHKAAEYLQHLEQQLQTKESQGRAAIDLLEEEARVGSQQVHERVRTTITTLEGHWHTIVNQISELLPDSISESSISESTTPAEETRSGEKETDHANRS